MSAGRKRVQKQFSWDPVFGRFFSVAALGHAEDAIEGGVETVLVVQEYELEGIHAVRFTHEAHLILNHNPLQMHLRPIKLLIPEVLHFVAQPLIHCRASNSVVLTVFATLAIFAVGPFNHQPIRGDVIEDLGGPVRGANVEWTRVKPLLSLYLCQRDSVVPAETMFLSSELFRFGGNRFI